MGVYRLLLSGINLVAALALPGVIQVLVRHIPRGEFGIYPRLFRLKLKVGALSVIGFVGFSFFSFDDPTFEQLASLYVIALMLPFYFSSQIYEAGYQAQMKFRELSTIYVGRASLQLVSFLGAYLLLSSVFSAMASMICAMTAYHFCNHLRIKREFAAHPDTASEPAGVVNREAVMISIFTILPAVMENIDKIIIERSAGLAKLATYSIGVGLGLAVNEFLKPFLTSINAKLVHRTPQRQHYLLILIGGTLIGGAFSVISPYLVPAMYGDSYAESVPITNILTASMGVYFCKTLYFNHLMFNKEKKLKAVYIGNIAAAIGTIAYLTTAMALVRNPDTLLIAFAFAYPFKMLLSISSLWMFGRLYR